MATPDILLREGMSIVDLSDELPSVAGRSYRSRPLSGVRKIVTHHSGALGRPGIQGVRDSANYVVRSRPALIRLPYTFWIPWEPESAKPAVYLCNPLDRHAFHSGSKANRDGVAICLQGSFPTSDALDRDGRFGTLEARQRPSEFQREAWQLLMTYLGRILPPGTKAYGHRDVGKKHTCPGSEPYSWVRAWNETP